MRVLVLLTVLSVGMSASAAVKAPPTRRTQSFVVQDLRGEMPSTVSLKSGEGKPVLKLDLDVLTLSAERVKLALCRELDLSTRGGGKINLFLVSATAAGPEITFSATSFADGWRYRLNIPDQLEDMKLVRGLVGILLLELANRGAGPKSAEIPVWLNEGLSLQLRNTMGLDLTLQSVPLGSMWQSLRDVRGTDKLQEARSVLRSSAAFTFAELGHPEIEVLQGEVLKRYQNSAQLFVDALCRLPNGRACLINMLRELPSCWNSETAFLRAFNRHFARPLDIEKWWSVVLTSFTGRDPNQVWPADACLERLGEVLLKPAQVRLSRDVMPVLTYVTPQQIIVDWDMPAQKAALEQTIWQLAILRSNCPKKVAELVDRYRLVFQTYLQKRFEANSVSGTKGLMVSAPLLVRQTTELLDELYRQREAMRREAAAPAASQPQR